MSEHTYLVTIVYNDKSALVGPGELASLVNNAMTGRKPYADKVTVASAAELTEEVALAGIDRNGKIAYTSPFTYVDKETAKEMFTGLEATVVSRKVYRGAWEIA